MIIGILAILVGVWNLYIGLFVSDDIYSVVLHIFFGVLAIIIGAVYIRQVRRLL